MDNNSNPDNILLCQYCGKIFYKLSTFESHTKWKHVDLTSSFMCDQCGKIFQKKFNLVKHLASGVHNISESINCTFCNFRSLTRKIMCGHYKSTHGIILNENNAYFRTLEEFFIWKAQYENDTRSRFVKMSSSRQRKNGYLRSTYFCHRDGNFVSKGKSVRHLKTKGSNKINAHCPAKIDVEVGENQIIVTYVETHLGHDLDISRINLDTSERALIAEKLTLKVPFEEILDEINGKDHYDAMKRINSITRKDLWNIVETYKINPKSVVNRKRREKQRKPVPSKMIHKENNVLIRVVDDTSSTKHIRSLDNNLVEQNNSETRLISMKSNSEDNVYLCPVTFADGNSEEGVQHYVILSRDKLLEDQTFVINSEGELENVSENQFAYSDVDEQGGENNLSGCSDNVVTLVSENGQVLKECTVQILDDTSVEMADSDSIQVDENGLILDYDRDGGQVFEDNQIVIYEGEEEDFQLYDRNIVETFENDQNSEVAKVEDADNVIFRCVKVKPNKMKQSFISCQTNDPLIKEEQLEIEDSELNNSIKIEPISVDDQSEFIVENDNNCAKYVITSISGQDMNYYNIISNNEAIDQGDTDLDISTVKNENSSSFSVVLEDEDESLNTIKQEESNEIVFFNTDNLEECDNRQSVSGWSVKGEKVMMNKLVRVHNMNNNDQQLRIFSNNITSLSNVKMLMSKNDY